MNPDEFAGKWRQIRGRIQEKLGQLTDGELDEMAGNYDILVGKIQRRHGESKEEIERELNALENGASWDGLP